MSRTVAVKLSAPLPVRFGRDTDPLNALMLDILDAVNRSSLVEERVQPEDVWMHQEGQCLVLYFDVEVEFGE